MSVLENFKTLENGVSNDCLQSSTEYYLECILLDSNECHACLPALHVSCDVKYLKCAL